MAAALISGYLIDPAWLTDGHETNISVPRLSTPHASKSQLLEVYAQAPLPVPPGKDAETDARTLTPSELEALRQFFELLDQWDRKEAQDSL